MLANSIIKICDNFAYLAGGSIGAGLSLALIDVGLAVLARVPGLAHAEVHVHCTQPPLSQSVKETITKKCRKYRGDTLSRSPIHEHKYLFSFLGIILRVLRLEVSINNVYITNQFQTTFAQGGRVAVKSISRGDCE
jgi:hypothetical protein